MGTLGIHWIVVEVAVALLFSSAIVGFLVIRGKRALVLVTLALGISGWLALAAGVQPGVAVLTGDTVAGTAVPPAPGLVPAGSTAPTTSAKPVAPDPMSLLKPGDCVEVPMEAATDASGAPTWKPGSPDPADCTSLDANYRVLQTGPEPCAGPLFELETSRKDHSGKQLYHLCLAFDWRVGVCYDTAHMDEPSKVDCGTPGDHIVQATAVLEDSTSGAGCPRDGKGAVWVVWDKRRMTVCFRGGDDPGK